MITGKYELRRGLFGRLIIWVEDNVWLDREGNDLADLRTGKIWRKALKYEKDLLIRVINEKGDKL